MEVSVQSSNHHLSSKGDGEGQRGFRQAGKEPVSPVSPPEGHKNGDGLPLAATETQVASTETLSGGC